jgi:hypothetical protein
MCVLLKKVSNFYIPEERKKLGREKIAGRFKFSPFDFLIWHRIFKLLFCFVFWSRAKKGGVQISKGKQLNHVWFWKDNGASLFLLCTDLITFTPGGSLVDYLKKLPKSKFSLTQRKMCVCANYRRRTMKPPFPSFVCVCVRHTGWRVTPGLVCVCTHIAPSLSNWQRQ